MISNIGFIKVKIGNTIYYFNLAEVAELFYCESAGELHISFKDKDTPQRVVISREEWLPIEKILQDNYVINTS